MEMNKFNGERNGGICEWIIIFSLIMCKIFS